MDINVYLPDELGAQAKEAGVKFSALLRDAVTLELRQRNAVESALVDSGVHTVHVEDDNGRCYDARIHGVGLARNARTDDAVFLTDSRQVIVYEGRAMRLHYVQSDPDVPLAEALRAWLDEDAYIDTMNALGLEPVIDIGMAHV
jgi:hypothetical protein